MNVSLRAKLFASAFALGVVPLAVTTFPAFAQEEVVSFRAFHRALAAHGDWVYSDRWGEVWIPADVPDDFHPYYTAGYWADTDEYGWLWVSNYEWGDITFHFGRWVNDPDDGWMWIPGYVWSPGWVVWRSNGHYTGWMPMPPDEGFLNGYSDTRSFGVSIDFNRTDDFYGYSRWYGRGYDENRFALNWVFIGTGNLSDRDYRSHSVSRTNVVNVIHTTTNVTNYTVVNNYIVNRSVDTKTVEHAGGHPVHAVPAATLIKTPSLITGADTGRAVQVRMRHTQPRGTGIANSAPQPSQDVVGTLSTRSVVHHGRAPVHLFTQTTIVNAPLKPTTPFVPTPAAIPGSNAAPSGSDTKPHHGGTGPTGPLNGAMTGLPAGRALAPVDHKVGGNGAHANPDSVHPITTPTVAPSNPSADHPGTTLNGAASMSGSPAAAIPSTADRHNRDRHIGGQGAGGSMGGATTPPVQITPTITPTARTNLPTDLGGRNRDRHVDGQDSPAVGRSTGVVETPPVKTTPTITPTAPTNPPADLGGRNRDRHKGGQSDQGASGSTGVSATPPVKSTPAINPPPAVTNPPADKSKDHRKHKDGQDNQGSDPNTPK